MDSNKVREVECHCGQHIVNVRIDTKEIKYNCPKCGLVEYLTGFRGVTLLINHVFVNRIELPYVA